MCVVSERETVVHLGDIAIMDEQNRSGSARKRGHQHHIRNEGVRRSNVPADEIIAALRAGDVNATTVAVTATPIAASSPTISIDQQQQRRSDMELNMAVDNDNNNNYNVIYNDVRCGDENDDDVTMLNADDDNRNNNRRSNSSNRNNNQTIVSDRLSSIGAASNNNNVLIDSTNEWLNGLNQSSGGAGGPGAAGGDAMQDSVSSGSSTSTTKKSKSKRDTKKGNAKGDANDAVVRKEKRKRTKGTTNTQAPPNEERPPLEGAAAEFDMGDVENDPEAAEWSKLRCTSERTEVVAEREYRRQNRRCADYPGLAFGRSIFSSDTMMKLNIIRNELHNIMKTQLKRVRKTNGYFVVFFFFIFHFPTDDKKDQMLIDNRR